MGSLKVLDREVLIVTHVMLIIISTFIILPD